MNPEHTRTLTVRANPSEAFSALLEAARRAGFRFLSSDASEGTAVFTSARVMLNFGERIHARVVEVAPGTVQVTLASTPANTAGGGSRTLGVGADEIGDVLSTLLPLA